MIPEAGLKTPLHRSDWQTARLKFLLQRKSRPPREEDGVVTAFRDGVVTLRSRRREDGFTFADKEIGYQGVEPGDLVIHAMDGFAGAIGVSDSRGKCSPVYTVTVPRPNAPAHTRFWAYYLRNLAVSGFIESLAKGIRERSTDFRWKDAGNLLVNFPDIETQRGIAEFLDRETAQIDGLIEKKQRLMALSWERFSSFRAQLFSGTYTRWKLSHLTIHEKNSIVNGPFGSDLLTSELTEEGVPVIYSGDVKDGAFKKRSKWHVTDAKAESLKFCNVMPGDLLMAKVGAPPGTTAVYPTDAPPAIVTQDVIRLRLDYRKVRAAYACEFFNSEIGKATIAEVTIESTRSRFPLSAVKAIRIPVPPIEEQDRILIAAQRKRAHVEPLAASTEESIDRLREFRAALITAAVTGQIDVVTWEREAQTDRRLDRIEEAMRA